MKNIFLFFFFIIKIDVYPQPAIFTQTFEWAKRLGGNGNNAGKIIATDFTGNSYIYGKFEGIVTFGSQTLSDINGNGFLAKYDTIGNIKWVLQLNKVYVNYMKANDQYVYLTAMCYQGVQASIDTVILNGFDRLFARIDNSGTINLLLTGSATGYYPGGVDIDAAGNFYIAGGYIDSTSSGIYVIKYDTVGNIIWSNKGSQTTLNCSVGAICINDAGTVGYVLGGAEGGGGIPDTVFFNNSTLYFTAGSSDYSNFVFQFNGNGNLQRLMEGPYGGNHWGIADIDEDNWGNLFVATYHSYGPFTIKKYNQSLTPLWAVSDPATFDAGISDIEIDTGGNVYAAGYFQAPGIFSGDTLGTLGYMSCIVKYDSSGIFKSVKGISTNVNTDGNSAFGISKDGQGNLYVTGFFDGTASFDSITYTTNGQNDLYLAKLQNNVTSNVVTNVLCNGQCNGTATALYNGGQQPYTYLWAPNGQTTATITGICVGTYTYTVTDSIGSTFTSSVTITQPNPLLLSETHTNLCDDQCSGTIILTATGGNPPYTYIGATSGLCAGTYTYTVTDANGCTAGTTATITHATEIIVSVSAENTSTFINSTTNSLTGTPAGGMFSGAGVYGTNFNPSIAGLGTWPVTYTYTDENGCTDSATINITVDMSTGIATSAGEGAALEIYPNPTSGIFSINLKNKTGETKICVYDVSGICVVDKVSKNDKEKIDLTNLPKGIYTLEIEADGENVMKKIILQ